MINRFTDYCRQIGILDTKSKLPQHNDLAQALFKHLLSLGREELISLSNRILNNWKTKDQSFSSSQLNNSTSSHRKSHSSSKLYKDTYKKQEQLIKQEQIKFTQELKGCTFKPQINPTSPKLQTPVYDRLSKQGKNKEKKIRINQEIKERKEMIECTFKPEIYSKSPRNSHISSSKSHERLYSDANTQKLKRDLLSAQQDTQHYTFKPQILKTPQNLQNYVSVPVEDRLYQHFIDKMQQDVQKEPAKLIVCTFSPQINPQKKQKESNEKQNQSTQKKSEPLSEKTTRSPSHPNLMSTKSKQMIEEKKKQRNSNPRQDSYFDRIGKNEPSHERLYKEHKVQKRKQQQRQKDQFNEKYTFKPEIKKKSEKSEQQYSSQERRSAESMSILWQQWFLGDQMINSIITQVFRPSSIRQRRQN